MKLSNAQLVQTMERALQQHNAGNLLMAEALYQQTLEHQPRQYDALHYLGLIWYAKPDAKTKQEGLKLVERSLKLSPNNHIFINNLSTIYIDAKDWPNALRICKQVIALRPTFAGGHHNLGLCYRALAKFSEAQASLQRAIDLAPENANIHVALGLTYLDKEAPAECIDCMKTALTLNAQCYDAMAGLGSGLLLAHRWEECSKILSDAIQLKPSVAVNYAMLAIAQIQLGHLSAAKKNIGIAVAMDVQDGAIWSARAAYGSALGLQAMVDEAFTKLTETSAVTQVGYSNYLFTKLHDPKISAAQLFDLHRGFARRFEIPLISKRKPFFRPRDANKRLRIGYISGDFRAHVVLNFILPVLIHHDQKRQEVYCYYTHSLNDDATKQVRDTVNVWRQIDTLSADEAAAQIRADQIDVLIDLSGHTAFNALSTLMRKPAPLQVTWIGYPGTTGLSAMDYRITDANLDPIGVTDQYHSEALLRLSSCSATFRPSAISPEVNDLPALKNGYLTFASLNVSRKINSAVVACWSKILKALPTSRLIICGIADELVGITIIDMFEKCGVGAAQIHLQKNLDFPAFLKLHHEVDLAFDPFPYNGGTTSLNALWMGIPFITWPGSTTASNVGAAVLRPLSLVEFIVDSEAAYVEKAVALSSNLPHLSSIRNGLRERMTQSRNLSPQELTVEVEALYRMIWQKWCVENPL
jgi:protein O-GlcNAc transferase